MVILPSMKAPSSVLSAVASMSPQTRLVRRSCTFRPWMLPRTAPATETLRAWMSALMRAVSPTNTLPPMFISPLKLPSKRTFASQCRLPFITECGPSTVAKPIGWASEMGGGLLSAAALSSATAASSVSSARWSGSAFSSSAFAGGWRRLKNVIALLLARKAPPLRRLRSDPPVLRQGAPISRAWSAYHRRAGR